MEYLKDRIKGLFVSSLVSSIIMLILGILLLIEPDFVLGTISLIVGLVILIPGVISLVDYFKNKYNANLIVGVIACILGLIFIFNSEFVVSILPFVLGIYFIISGLSKLQYGLTLRSNQIPNYMRAIIASVLTLACGVLLMINPFGGAIAFTQVAGIFTIVYAVLDIYNACFIRKEMKQVMKRIEK